MDTKPFKENSASQPMFSPEAPELLSRGSNTKEGLEQWTEWWIHAPLKGHASSCSISEAACWPYKQDKASPFDEETRGAKSNSGAGGLVCGGGGPLSKPSLSGSPALTLGTKGIHRPGRHQGWSDASDWKREQRIQGRIKPWPLYSQLSLPDTGHHWEVKAHTQTHNRRNTNSPGDRGEQGGSTWGNSLLQPLQSPGQKWVHQETGHPVLVIRCDHLIIWLSPSWWLAKVQQEFMWHGQI